MNMNSWVLFFWVSIQCNECTCLWVIVYPWLNKQYLLLLRLLDLVETMCNGMAIYFHDQFQCPLDYNIV
jgi:hypothetical protein